MIALGQWRLEFQDPGGQWFPGQCCYRTYRDAHEASEFLTRVYGMAARIVIYEKGWDA